MLVFSFISGHKDGVRWSLKFSIGEDNTMAVDNLATQVTSIAPFTDMV